MRTPPWSVLASAAGSPSWWRGAAGWVVALAAAALTLVGAARGWWLFLGVTAGLALAGAAAWLAQRAIAGAAERAAREARRDFLDGMSHELRTPLNSVIGFSNVLLRNDALTPRERQYLERVRANGEQLLGVIEELFARAERERGGAGAPRGPAAGDR
jgi:signal transduction histidine kinase